MKITKGTIVRAVMTAAVIVNIVLKRLGLNPLSIEEGTVSAFVEAAAEIAVIAVSFWKNNSFSQNAIKADEFLKELNADSRGADYEY